MKNFMPDAKLLDFQEVIWMGICTLFCPVSERAAAWAIDRPPWEFNGKQLEANPGEEGALRAAIQDAGFVVASVTETEP